MQDDPKHSCALPAPGMACRHKPTSVSVFTRSQMNILTTVTRCFVHIISLANVDFMSCMTKITIVENTSTILEYDPTLPDNKVMNGSLDVIAAARTLMIKVSLLLVAISIS